MNRLTILFEKDRRTGLALREPMTLDFDGEARLDDLLDQVGLSPEKECAGKGVCGNCVVLVAEGKYETRTTGANLDPEFLREGFVLACQTKVKNDITIKVSKLTPHRDKPMPFNENVLISRRLIPEKREFTPLSRKFFLKVTSPALDDNFSDFDRVVREMDKQLPQKKTPFCELELLRKLPDALREQNGEITVSLSFPADTCDIISFQPGNAVGSHFGIACDIGTTTIAAHLVDLNTGEIAGTETDYNKQLNCGADVISRIDYAGKNDKLRELQELAVRVVNELGNRLTEKRGINKNDVSSAVFSGNTTMAHLFLAINPRYIREEPYVPAINVFPRFKARELGLACVNSHAVIFLAPGVGSYVGGDITSGMLCVERSEEIMVYLDIGTNGELVIGNSEWLMTCACSAGPAFEGGGVDCGMRADYGAIEKIAIEKNMPDTAYEVIGRGRPRGLGGSALIELVGELFKHGVIDQAGRFGDVSDNRRVQTVNNRKAFIVEYAENTEHGKDIYLSESDIQNLLRAKAAIFAALRLLLKKVGLSFDDISKAYISGGFGKYLNIENAISIGLLPDIDRNKFQYIGNSSLTGGYLSLLSKKHREKLRQIADSMTYVELSVEPNYMDEYSAALFLPHTDISCFPSLRKQATAQKVRVRFDRSP